MQQLIKREFFCVGENQTIYTKEFVEKSSREAGNMPALIISHGFGGNGDDNDAYGEHFAKLGYAVYSFDFCGGRGDGVKRSTGDSMDLTIASECEDLTVVLKQVKELPYINSQRISLMGMSMGGFVSGLVAAKCKDEIENIILIYPAMCIPDDARRGCLAGTVYDVNCVPDVIECSGQMRIGRIFHEQIKDMDPYLELCRYKGRVLIVQGLQDSLVNYSYAIRAKECYEPGQCQLHIIRNAGHWLDAEQTESVKVAIEHFLGHKKEQLRIEVFLTEYKVLEETKYYKKAAVYFTGYCDCENFRGSILPGAVDVQEQHQNQELSLRADYTLEGIDSENRKCKIHILNQKKGKYFKPEIHTDSPKLAYLQEMDLTASLEGFHGGLTVRIFG